MTGEARRLSFDKPLTKAEQRAAAGKAPATTPRRTLRDRIPTLPKVTVDPDVLTKPDQRAVATVNMKLAGASFVDIARELSYATPKDAETAFISALSTMYPISSWEILRQEAALRAEERLRRSHAMATADYFVDANDPEHKIANVDKLRWHEMEGKDLALLVTITGAKAPARMEINADTAMLAQMAAAVLAGQANQPELEASVWDIDDIDDADEVIEP